jgi:hypothetical protein
MPKPLSKQLRFLEKVCALEPQDQETFLKNLKKHQVRFLCEICLNLKQKNLKLTKTLVKALTKYKNIISYLAERGCWKNKKRAIRSAGLFLFKLLCPAFLRILTNNFTKNE